jgi:solute carrier family 27 fatty acid transporter 6
VEEGFNPLKISDPLYFLDNFKKAYVPLTKELYDHIISEKLKF